jgi:hypothetical protein
MICVAIRCPDLPKVVRFVVSHAIHDSLHVGEGIYDHRSCTALALDDASLLEGLVDVIFLLILFADGYRAS